MNRSLSPDQVFFPENLRPDLPLLNTKLLAMSVKKSPVPHLSTLQPSLPYSNNNKTHRSRVAIRHEHKLPSLNAGISLLPRMQRGSQHRLYDDSNLECKLRFQTMNHHRKLRIDYTNIRRRCGAPVITVEDAKKRIWKNPAEKDYRTHRQQQHLSNRSCELESNLQESRQSSIMRGDTSSVQSSAMRTGLPKIRSKSPAKTPKRLQYKDSKEMIEAKQKWLNQLDD